MSNPFSLGRLFNPADELVHLAKPVSRLLGSPSPATERYHFSNGWWGDQGDQPQCVAYAWTHWLEDGPVKHSGTAPCIQPSYLYKEAQKIDGIPLPHDGTTTLAAAETLKRLGHVADYHFATSLDDVVQTILQLGPVCIGTDWYADMFYPDAAGFIHIGGGIAGGHETKLDGVNVKQRFFRGKNSWGRNWGAHGFYLLGFDDFQKLLDDGGDACLATEIGVDVP